MKILQFSAVVSLAGIVAFPSPAPAQEAVTDPVGVVNFEIAAGTGTSKVVSTLSLPLLNIAQLDGLMAGVLTDVTSSTISNSIAGWTPGQLSNPASPLAIEFTSGEATGMIVMLSTATANTATTVNIDSTELPSINFVSVGVVAGDRYRLLAVETLLSFFGTPSSPEGLGVVGSSSPANADIVMLEVNGQFFKYYYNINFDRWTRISLGSPDATHTRIPPRGGLVYSRIADSPIQSSFIGSVSTVSPVYRLKNAGVSFVGQNLPVPINLSALGLHLLPEWSGGANANVSDTIRVMISGIWRTYWYDGSNWRRQSLGSPLSNTVAIEPGSLVLINQRGVESGFTLFEVPLPYNLTSQN